MPANSNIPKYVLKMLERRRNLALDLMVVNQNIFDYCEKIGMDVFDPDACLLSDVRIYCEMDGAYSATLSAIQKHLNQEASHSI